MDNLAYTYDSGNKLLKVTDTGNKTYGFKDGANTGNDYTYDVNGNLTKDTNKEVTSISYNHLNMPAEIKLNNSNNKKVNYVYDAYGTKLRKVKSENGTTTTTDYAGDYIYENNVLQSFSHSEGYVEPRASGGFEYVYQYTDIWNNVRLSYADSDGNGIISQAEIKQERNFYPFGLEHKGYNSNIVGRKHNKETFQDQEFTEDLGLNIHEWRYRISDATIGRFWQIDPLAEDYVYNSTYAFAENKLGSGIELEGLEITSFDLRQTRRDKSLIKGEITQKQYLESSSAEGKGALAALSLVLPGPEDLVIAGFVSTKIGGAVLKGLSKIFGKGSSKVDDVVDVATSTKKVNKNSNNAEGNFVLYEVKEGKEILKVGKANADDVMADGVTIRRVHTSTRKAKKEGYKKATGEVVQDLGKTTTGKAKKAEASRVVNHRKNGKKLPLNRERSKAYQPKNNNN
jgi:RHS repeat-associated protein